MFCKECGKEIENDSKFCSYCGTKQSTKIYQSDNPELEPISTVQTQNIDISLSFGRPKKKATVEPVVRIEKYDKTYQGDSNATITGIVIIVINIVILFAIRSADLNDPQVYIAFAALVNLIWRIIATVWVINIAKRQNRNPSLWGIFAFIIPNLALIIIGFLKKLLKNSPNLIEENNILGPNQIEENNILGPNLVDSQPYHDFTKISYNIVETYKTNFFAGDRKIFSVEFIDGKKGNIYTYNESTYSFHNTLENKHIYYNTKESAIYGLHYFLTTQKVLDADRYV